MQKRTRHGGKCWRRRAAWRRWLLIEGPSGLLASQHISDRLQVVGVAAKSLLQRLCLAPHMWAH